MATKTLSILTFAELPAPDVEGIYWIERKSEKGVPFVVGFKLDKPLNQEAYDAAVAQKRAVEPESEEIAVSSSGSVSVYWPVGNTKWKETSKEARDNSISRYYLFKSTNPMYSYEVDFTNTGKWGFTFYDETGDYYNCMTVWNTDHYVKYNSDKPTITSFSPW